MNYLVGDIGNTSTKICLVNKNFRVIKELSINTKKLLINVNIEKLFKPVLKKKIKKKNSIFKCGSKNLQKN